MHCNVQPVGDCLLLSTPSSPFCFRLFEINLFRFWLKFQESWNLAIVSKSDSHHTKIVISSLTNLTNMKLCHNLTLQTVLKMLAPTGALFVAVCHYVFVFPFLGGVLPLLLRRLTSGSIGCQKSGGVWPNWRRLQHFQVSITSHVLTQNLHNLTNRLVSQAVQWWLWWW